MNIFVANTGRCGSEFMAYVVDKMTDYPAFHEPVPYGAELMKAVNNEGCMDEKILEEKFKAIRSATVAGNYFESSNMFIKVWAEAVVENMEDVCCIYLERNPLDVLISFAEYVTYHNAPFYPTRSFLNPSWQHNLLRIPGRSKWAEAILWNWYEVKARFEKMKDLFHSTYSFHFEDLNSIKAWHGLFDHFGMKYNPSAPLPRVWKNTWVGNSGLSKGELVQRVQDLWGIDYEEWQNK